MPSFSLFCFTVDAEPACWVQWSALSASSWNYFSHGRSWSVWNSLLMKWIQHFIVTCDSCSGVWSVCQKVWAFSLMHLPVCLPNHCEALLAFTGTSNCEFRAVTAVALSIPVRNLRIHALISEVDQHEFQRRFKVSFKSLQEVWIGSMNSWIDMMKQTLLNQAVKVLAAWNLVKQQLNACRTF